MQVLVRDNNVDQALKALKKKMQREGIFREMKLRGHYEKPSEKKAREKAEAVRRARKLARKKLQREGLLPMKPKPVFGAGPGGERGGARRPRRSGRRSARTALILPRCRLSFNDAGPGPALLFCERCLSGTGHLQMRFAPARAISADGSSRFPKPGLPRLRADLAASRLRSDLWLRARRSARRLLLRSGLVGTGPGQAAGRREPTSRTSSVSQRSNISDAKAHRRAARRWRNPARPRKRWPSSIRALALDPYNAQALYGRGLLYQGHKQHQLAIDDFTAANGLAPQQAEPLLGRAISYLAIDKAKEAAADLDEAAQADPHNAQAWTTRGAGL